MVSHEKVDASWEPLVYENEMVRLSKKMWQMTVDTISSQMIDHKQVEDVFINMFQTCTCLLLLVSMVHEDTISKFSPPYSRE